MLAFNNVAMFSRIKKFVTQPHGCQIAFDCTKICAEQFVPTFEMIPAPLCRFTCDVPRLYYDLKTGRLTAGRPAINRRLHPRVNCSRLLYRFHHPWQY
jgi:hypothetical protein